MIVSKLIGSGSNPLAAPYSSPLRSPKGPIPGGRQATLPRSQWPQESTMRPHPGEDYETLIWATLSFPWILVVLNNPLGVLPDRQAFAETHMHGADDIQACRAPHH